MREEKGETATTEDEIELAIDEYLRHHPDFFTRHLPLLETLRVPHPCRPAVSLIERQLALLREQNAQLRNKLRELVAVARDNDFLAKRIQYLALELIEAGDLNEMLQGVQSTLRDRFNLDFAVLRLAADSVESTLSGAAELVTAECLAPFEKVLGSGRPQCGELGEAQLRLLFPDGAPEIGSAAVVPLRGADWKGVLAVGSQDPERFYPAMGTLFLSRMGELISHALQAHLHPLPETASS
jgi:uncharacterized protein YigA (DUF484 family)